MITVLVADDHALFRDGVRRILEADGRFKVVAEASNGREMMQRAREVCPQVVLLDISMPGLGGLDAVEGLKGWNAQVRVLMLTARHEDHYAVRCLKAGADGYLTKDQAPETLIQAILKIHEGGKYLSPGMMETLVLLIGGEVDSPPHESLSDREFQVLCGLGSGETVSEIAARLCLSSKTISTYRLRVLQKLNLDSTADLIRYALKEGLAE